MKNNHSNSRRGFSNYNVLAKPLRSQVTIFVIVALLIVGGIVLYFTLSGPSLSSIPKEMKPVYDYYLGCLEEQARQGVALLGEQGGYIEVPNFVPGSQYMPFSSQLDFFGQPIPYWMYVSGNNLLKEQIPSKVDMEKDLENYVGERLNYCDFTDFEMQGFDVFVGDGDGIVSVDIKEEAVEVGISKQIIIAFGDEVVDVSEHEFSLDSKLGKFHSLALNVYNYEKKNMFLENYALDVLNIYAPVTGVDLTCVPKIFVDEKIKQNLTQALSANIGALRLKGNYYDLESSQSEYFVTDIGQRVNENVNFIYNVNWPTRVEIYGDKVAEPVGLQEGLGILGFCYVPYHLVYDVDFPVLIQFWDAEEIFQFPMAVVIQKNQAREALAGQTGYSIESPVCDYPNQEVHVTTYDTNLNPVEARIKFKCLNSECSIGETKNVNGEAFLDSLMPSCVNGFVIASAEGFVTSKTMVSTNEESYVDVIMNRLYEIPIELNSGSRQALVSFKSEEYSTTVMYPDTKEVELAEGYYNVSVYVYGDSGLKFPATSEHKCMTVPQQGIGGLFGLEEEKCFDINIPSYDVDFAIVGGGHVAEYFTEGMLTDSSKLKITAHAVSTPKSINELQDNYMEVENSILGVSFE